MIHHEESRPIASDSGGRDSYPDASTGRRWIRAEKLALPAVVLLALLLRVWGLRHGLPYVFSADENAHFVPRAIGMFGHSLDPQYFVNPPAFTYLLHLAYWASWGSREAVGDAFAVDPATAFTIARALTALLGVAAVLRWLPRQAAHQPSSPAAPAPRAAGEPGLAEPALAETAS